MQTFLPVADFTETARLLDNPRLGKQRVECLQVLRALELPDYGWANHPVVTMWRGRPARPVLHPLGGGGRWRQGGVRSGERRVGEGGRSPRAPVNIKNNTQ